MTRSQREKERSAYNLRSGARANRCSRARRDKREMIMRGARACAPDSEREEVGRKIMMVTLISGIYV